ncbi:hypothetical protein TVAG_120220 [Trichomonas vaginalis G3]|uniref:Uncharacterized protein n=1 Tax=Trichomonas vaginalis (strain ATCC PRA-98 / G3) TaxID=412133 RepID=A2D7G7_TRIV3|nr:hypothetical protein TVAGG3_0993140 [Trichomonas vaginalis G3]EAY23684.1 hypothetical protein TVAG_120220 [Trichomonas vaginalis G3]KAI5490177.1 hypothetical protein TVAGG3_0993140 [Trichomonas vaginalis G3]|eukprot:XP_001276932.1 hypothetical protein [Trichomonas vaginalis G3]
MIQYEIAKSIENVINTMQNPSSELISFEDTSKNISAKISLKSSAMMSLELNMKQKDKEISITTDDFPIHIYHNSIARLIPIFHQLTYLEKHPEFCNPDLLMGFAATVANIILMLGENSLIKSENFISDLIPQNLRNYLIIACSPIGDFFLLTIHTVKLVGDAQSVDGVTHWRQYAPDTKFSHLKKEYSVIDSCLMKSKFKPQVNIIAQLRSIQMQLTSAATMISIDDEEEES